MASSHTRVRQTNIVTQLDGIQLVPPRDDSFVNPRVYFSAPLFDLEMRRVFPRSWIFVADVSQLKKPGDYVTDFIGYEPILVIRDSNMVLRAFSNVCRHRGTIIAQGTGNCGKTLVCPYHGWSYQLDGKLTGVSFRRRLASDIDPADFGLVPLRVDTWEQFVFVNVSGNAPPLHDYLQPAPDLLRAHGLSDVLRVHSIDDVVDINWKILIDNGFEDYHLPFVHAKSGGKLYDIEAAKQTEFEYAGLAVAPASPYGSDTVATKSELEGEARTATFAISVFPNLIINAFPSGGASLMWWTPISVEQTRARVSAYLHEGDVDPRGGEEGFRLLRQIQDEDYEVCARVQKGLRSNFYAPGPRHDLELRVKTFQTKLMNMLADEVVSQIPD